MSTITKKTTTPASSASTVADLTQKIEAIQTRLDASEKATAEARRGAPFIRKGESVLTSRGFQFSRLIGVAVRRMDANQAKVEMHMCERLRDEYEARGLFSRTEKDSVTVPLSSELMLEACPESHGFVEEVRECVSKGVEGADRGEMLYHMKRLQSRRQKTLSWTDAGSGMELVPPPVFGEPIDLLRNTAVFLAAGAQVIPFPASGRAVWPRITGPSTGYWLGSGASDRDITPSEITTGDLVLTVKKLGIVVQIPNELFRFPSVSVEALIRADMMMQAALTMDKAFIQGVGSATEPKGIINYDNIRRYEASTTPTPAGLGVNGNTVEPEDPLNMIADISEQNVDFRTWVGRAKLYAGLANKRADAATSGDRKGMFLFDVLRTLQASSADATQPGKGSLCGYPFFLSNQIPRDRVKGGSNDLSLLLFGDFSKYMVAMSGVMEFAVATQGTIFRADQSELRLITWCDGAPRYEEAFGVFDYLYQNG